MKKLLIVIGLVAFFMLGCQKEKESPVIIDTTSLQQLTSDDLKVDNAIDESMNDASEMIGTLKSTEILPCNATLDSVKVFNDTNHYYITYNGLNCAGTKLRNGQIEIDKKVGTNWVEADATIIVKHINFKVTKVSNGKWIIINGKKSLKNVTGGLISQLGGSITSVVHKIEGNVEITFENNTTKNWNIRRLRTFTGDFNQHTLIMTVDGFGSADGYDNLVTWGQNRNGENFYTQILQSVVFRQICDWNPCQGIRKYNIPSDQKSATITYGYDINNQPISGDACPVKYKVDWVKGNKSGTFYLYL